MKTSTFWTSVVIATFIIFGCVAVIGSSDRPEESGVHGYIVFVANGNQYSCNALRFQR